MAAMGTVVIRKYCNTLSESTVVLLYRDCYGRFALFWPMGKLKFEFSLSVSTQFRPILQYSWQQRHNKGLYYEFRDAILSPGAS